MHRAPQLAIFGRFNDALSGEFVPATDPERKLQTLGRLMIDSYNEKDEILLPHSFQELRTYRPYWAPISSVVRVVHDDDLRSLRLTSKHNQLFVDHYPNQDGTRTIKIYSDDNDTPELSALLNGENSSAIRGQVTEIAQDFFDKVAKNI